MSDKEDIEIDDDFVAEEDGEAVEAAAEVAKTNLTKRRVIDNLLEERRLQKQLADFDYDF